MKFTVFSLIYFKENISYPGSKRLPLLETVFIMKGSLMYEAHTYFKILAFEP